MSKGESRAGHRASLGERWGVFLFLGATLVVPLVAWEWFPFSAPTMFSERTASYCHYRVWDESGDRVSRSEVGLQCNNPHDPPLTTFGRRGYGRLSPETLNHYDAVPTVEEIREHVQARAEGRRLVVRRRVIGAVDEDRIGIVQEDTFEVEPR
jgi:hypothetical protein